MASAARRADAGLGRDELDRSGDSGEDGFPALERKRFHERGELGRHRSQEADAGGAISVAHPGIMPRERRRVCQHLAMLANYGSGLYKTLLVLHILTAIVGLGAVMLNGLYAAQAQKRQGPGGRAISEANLAVSTIGEYFIYAIPVFGILLVLDSDKLWKFSQTWIWLACSSTSSPSGSRTRS